MSNRFSALPIGTRVLLRDELAARLELGYEAAVAMITKAQPDPEERAAILQASLQAAVAGFAFCIRDEHLVRDTESIS